MRCTCGKPGTIILRRRSFPYCEECFRHTIVKLFRAEVGDGPVFVQPRKPQPDTADHELDEYYRQALQALAQEARREIIEDTQGAVPGSCERAAAAASRFLFGEQETLLRVIPASIYREELERFFKPAPKETSDAVERDLSRLEERYPGTLASVIKSAEDRVEKQQ